MQLVAAFNKVWTFRNILKKHWIQVECVIGTYKVYLSLDMTVLKCERERRRQKCLWVKKRASSKKCNRTLSKPLTGCYFSFYSLGLLQWHFGMFQLPLDLSLWHLLLVSTMLIATFILGVGVSVCVYSYNEILVSLCWQRCYKTSRNMKRFGAFLRRPLFSLLHGR